MARLSTLVGVTLPKRSYGVVYATQAAGPTARSLAVPVQPHTTQQAYSTVAMAVVANFWAFIGPTQQNVWNTFGGATTGGYGLFSSINLFCATWGLPLFDAPPTAELPSIVSVYFINSDIATETYQFTGVEGAIAVPPHEYWVHLYLDPSTVSSPTPAVDNGNVYIGAFGPNPPGTAFSYDITAIMMQIFGQWLYPGTFDTTTGKSCGFQIYGATCDTDQSGQGWSGDFGFPVPTGQYDLGFSGGSTGPGACTGVPTSHAVGLSAPRAHAYRRLRAVVPLKLPVPSQTLARWGLRA